MVESDTTKLERRAMAWKINSELGRQFSKTCRDNGMWQSFIIEKFMRQWIAEMTHNDKKTEE